MHFRFRCYRTPGISDNLADKAKKLGIPLLDYRKSLPKDGSGETGM